MFYVTVLYVNEYSSNIEVPVNDSNTINQLLSVANVFLHKETMNIQATCIEMI